MSHRNLQGLGIMGKTESFGTHFEMDTREIERFSVDNALRYLIDPGNYSSRTGLESEIAARALKSSAARHEGGVFLPWAVLARDVRAMGLPVSRRDLVVGTPTAGGHLVGTDIKGFVDALYPFTAVVAAGATTMTGLVGNTAIPQSGSANEADWVAENGSPTEREMGFAQAPMSPKTVSTYMDVSRRLMLQSSVDVMAVVKRDMLRRIAVRVDEAALIGPSGSATQPKGVANTAGVGAIIGGENGAVPTLRHLIDLENYVQSAGLERFTGAFITNFDVKGKLQRTEHFTGTDGRPLWQAVGEQDYCNGRPAYATTLVPNNLTKGTSSEVCSAIFYGLWSELVIGVWGDGVTVLVDPYTGSTAGTVRLVAMFDCDIAVRQPVAFAAMTDVLTSDS